MGQVSGGFRVKKPLKKQHPDAESVYQASTSGGESRFAITIGLSPYKSMDAFVLVWSGPAFQPLLADDHLYS